MTSDALASPAPRLSHSRVDRNLAMMLVLTALADWLFFDRALGISVALFALAAAAALRFADPTRLAWLDASGAVALLALGLLPLIEAISPLSLMFAGLGTCGFALCVSGGLSPGWRGAFADLQSLLTAPLLLVPELAGASNGLPRASIANAPAGLAMWIVPLGLGGVFLLLFSSANPLIEDWLSGLDLRVVLDQLSVGRALFWFAFASVAWGFVTLRHGRRFGATVAAPKVATAAHGPQKASLLFGEGAILRSLVVFNLMFALQSGLDLAFLWRGGSLPGGMTYAAYAHRGAWPLMGAAILAGAFVLAAMRPGTAAERSTVVRGLVFLWTGQTVLLVLSAILRLDLYVATYSLTMLRMAAFVWMGLVAAGLVLIIVRIALDRSNAWLISASAAVTLATLYACSFVNFAGVIADYNVAHCREVTDQGIGLDQTYLASLGPQAIPALDRYIEHHLKARQWPTERMRAELAMAFERRSADWRAWTWREHRLAHYLARYTTPVR